MAKKRARRRKPGPTLAPAPPAPVDLNVAALLHELQVRSEEIAVQNEQLIKAQHELEQARHRFADLYDFAPVGFVSLDWHGAIIEINLAGAALLGQPRGLLIGLPLAGLLDRNDRGVFRDFLLRAHGAAASAQPHVEVRAKYEPRTIRLFAKQPHPPHRFDELFTAMLDVTEERRLDAERIAALERERARTAALHKEIGVRLRAEERVKALLDRLVRVQERERRRLALNLHDHLGQQLTALRLTVDAARRAKPGSAEAQQRFDAIDRIVSQLDRDVDFLAWELRPPALDDVGLEAALEEYLRQWSSTESPQVDFHASLGATTRLPREVESHLYRIVQEALHNIRKHANATHASVLLERRDNEVTLIIEDDGSGFDIETVKTTGGAGMGLSGMQERAASAGGELQLESAPGKGTTVFVRLPIKVETPPSVG